MTYSQQLRELLQEKCPELMELSFGCEVKITEYMEERRILTVLCTDPEVKCFYNRNTEYLDWQYEILGHPPQLSHLLKCLGYGHTCIIGSDLLTITNVVTGISCDLVLSKLPCEQSELVCERLYNLIK